MSTLTQTVLEQIPDEYLGRFRALVDQPFRGTQPLRRALKQYDTTVRSVAPFVDFLDVDEAQQLLRACEALLDAAEASTEDDVHQLVQAAVLYLILEDEDEEITGVLGLDDDAQVLNAVARTLGMPQHIVQLKVHTFD